MSITVNLCFGGVLNYIDKICRYFVSSGNKTCLSRVVEGKGPAKPQQPVIMTSGAKSCRKAKMRGVLCILPAPSHIYAKGFFMSENYITEQFQTFESGIRLDSGRILAPITLAYETYGTLNNEKSNAILVEHA